MCYVLYSIGLALGRQYNDGPPNGNQVQMDAPDCSVYPMEKSRRVNQKWVPYVEGLGIDG